jgi:hypothetical protein
MKSLILPALLLAGCAVPTVDLPFDSDRDGLLDDEETRYGTDPANAHSDDDGWDHPYTGGWPIGACRHSLDGSGWNVGFTVHNTNNLDQNGDLVKLHDFCEVPYLLTYYTPT